MKKMARRIFVSLCAISLFFTIATPIISSKMQGYYKGLISNAPKNTQALLESKQTWVTIGETKIFAILFLIILFSFLITELVIWIKKSANGN